MKIIHIVVCRSTITKYSNNNAAICMVSDLYVVQRITSLISRGDNLDEQIVRTMYLLKCINRIKLDFGAIYVKSIVQIRNVRLLNGI